MNEHKRALRGHLAVIALAVVAMIIVSATGGEEIRTGALLSAAMFLFLVLVACGSVMLAIMEGKGIRACPSWVFLAIAVVMAAGSVVRNPVLTLLAVATMGLTNGYGLGYHAMGEKKAAQGG